MGRGRLRRGYSLEVIFEEDPDFCSHLDSLDSVAIRFGVKEADDTISVDSLVEEYQIRFEDKSDKEQVFRSLDGIWDIKDMDTCFVEWDEFSPESVSEMPPGGESFQSKGSMLEEVPQGNRRNRVSRRQIVEASWVFDSSDDSSNNDTETDISDVKDVELVELEIEPVLVPKPISNCSTRDALKVGADFPRQFPIDLRHDEESDLSPSSALFGNIMCRIVDGDEKDTLESYISTRTDCTETNAYNFADPFNDTASVASTNYESSASTSSSTGSDASVCTVNNLSTPSTPKSPNSSNNNSPPRSSADRFGIGSKYRTNLNVELQTRFEKMNNRHSYSSSSGGSNTSPQQREDPIIPSDASTSDVKRVRALFEGSGSSERSSRKSSLGEESSSSGGSGSKLYSKNPSSPTSCSPVGGVTKRLRQFGGQSGTSLQQQQQNGGVAKVLRSAFSQFNLNHVSSGGVDFAELLVNDKVVIEESDSLHYLRNRKGQNKEDQPTRSNCSTLRRSRSMGTGISNLGTMDSSGAVQSGLISSRTSIIATEMPAPDTVKNVRTVFEQILKMRASPNSNSSTSSNVSSIFNNASGAISIIKKSLSSVKSNPTSKIYRSESMKDNFQSGCVSLQPLNIRYGNKPNLVTESSLSPPYVPPVSSANSDAFKKHPLLERKSSEPIKFSPKINSPVSRPFREDYQNLIPLPLTEEESLSLMSSLNDPDSNEPKFVSPDILQRIRSCGTTTTYFGGEIVAQTVKNRKMPLNRRHTTAVTDFSGPGYNFSSCNSSSTGTTPTNFSITTEDNYIISSPSPTTSTSRNSSRFEDIPTPARRVMSMDIESMFQGVTGLLGGNSNGKGIDTTPRIISVLPKSPSSSPTKSGSPVGSIIEGRGTPEGCEEGQEIPRCQWINEIPVNEEVEIKITKEEKPSDGNNNEIVTEKAVVGIDKRFSQLNEPSTEGAWF